MRTHVTLATVLALAAGAAAAEPLAGTWQTEAGDDGNTGHVQIAPCGAKLCGTLVRSFDASGAEMGSDHIGRQIVWDMEPQGDGRYGKGKIWAPDRDKTYRSKLQLSGDTLKVSGCVGPICRAQTWARVK